MARKQLNIGITLAQYEQVRRAAEEEGVMVKWRIRTAVGSLWISTGVQARPRG